MILCIGALLIKLIMYCAISKIWFRGQNKKFMLHIAQIFSDANSLSNEKINDLGVPRRKAGRT